MPNGYRNPFANVSRSCAPPECSGSRSISTRPAPDSATNRSPFGAIVSNRGFLKLSAYTFTWKPSGAFGRNPSGRLVWSGPFPADFVENGFGRSGLAPCVTCALALRAAIAAMQPPSVNFPNKLCMCFSPERFQTQFLDAAGSSIVSFTRYTRIAPIRTMDLPKLDPLKHDFPQFYR